MTDASEAERVARGLTKAQQRDLTSNWDHFCQADHVFVETDDENYPAQLEEAGFVILDEVGDDDLETAFAEELGIEEGGSVYRLTPLGLSVRTILEQSHVD